MDQHMTVGELVEKLKQFDQSLPVCVYHREGGFVDDYDFDLEPFVDDASVYKGFGFREKVHSVVM